MRSNNCKQERNKAWGLVVLTCFFELCWVLGFNLATSLWHWIILIAVILLDFSFLSKACRTIPTGTVYAVFSAVGAVGATLMDIFLFDVEAKFIQIFFVILIVIGVVQLKLSDNSAA